MDPQSIGSPLKPDLKIHLLHLHHQVGRILQNDEYKAPERWSHPTITYLRAQTALIDIPHWSSPTTFPIHVSMHTSQSCNF